MVFVAGILATALWLYSLVIFGRIVLSWLPLRSGTFAYRVYGILYDVSEPYLRVFRRFLPLVRLGGATLDLSPLAGLVVLLIVQRLVVRL